MTNEPGSLHTGRYPGMDPAQVPEGDVLNRRVRSPFTGFGLCVAIILLVALFLRILRLDTYLLSAREGLWASTGWSLHTGSSLPGPMSMPEVSPLFQVLTGLSLALFGDTDATARLVPALLGFGIVVLIFSLRPFLTRSYLAATATLAAISPTLVFASRTIDPAVAVAFFSLLTICALLRAGAAETRTTRAGWSLLVGLGLAGMLASGINGISALLALAAGVTVAALTDSSGRNGEQRGVVRAGVTAIGNSAVNAGIVVIALTLAVVMLFSRLLTDFTALSGILTTFDDWGAMMMSRATAIPGSFYLWALLLYDILAVVFGLVAILSRRPPTRAQSGRLSPLLFATWFLVALLLHSFASGRETEHAVLVALPVILLGGMGLGEVFERIDASTFWGSRSWGVPMMVLGIATLLVFGIAIVERSMNADTSLDRFPSWIITLMVGSIVIITVGAVGAMTWSSGRELRVRPADPIMMFVAAGLTVFTIISTAGLAFERADEGRELLARNVPTQETGELIERINRVSRDLSVSERSSIDPTGRYGLRIAISPDTGWPYAWYLRDYPFLRVIAPAGWDAELDVAIAPMADAMETYGLTPAQTIASIRPPQTYTNLDAGDIFGQILDPGTWNEAVRYLVSREIENAQEPTTVTVGYSTRVQTQLNPSFGPFDLFGDVSPGPGSGQGQLNQPTGIDVSPDGEIIYILNSGNQRVDRFERDGTFLGVWDAVLDPLLALSWNVSQGGTGLTVADDGLVYIADTWNHVVIVVAPDGTVVRQLGQRGALTDITDEGDPTASPGLFFGPRDVAVTDDRIFVTDTGNERVQVFGRDGTFLTSFGGFGFGAGQFVEPTGIAVGPDGNVWVADSGNARIQVFTVEGEWVEEISVPSWEGQMGIDRINALRFGPDGVLYLTAPAAAIVEAYNGEEIVSIPNVPELRAGGITVTPSGALMITDIANATVLEIVPDLPEGFAAPGYTGTPASSPQATPAND